MEIPATYKAAVYDEPGTISTKIVELPTPEPGEGQVLIKLTHSGVCHSDLGVMTRSWAMLPYPTPKDQVGGHEGIGEVVKLGPGAERSGLSLGSRVGVKWLATVCGECAPCKAGRDGCCKKQTISGYFAPGTFQQYVLGPAGYVTPIPDGLSAADAAPMLCAGVTVYAALGRSRTKPGDWVVVSGAGGGLGHLAVQVASRGLGLRVVGVDHPSKESLVRESGAEHFVDMTKFPRDGVDLAAHVHGLCDGLGAHAVLVCTASNVAYAQALGLLRFDGTLVCVGVPEHDPEPIGGAFPSRIINGSFNIAGSVVGNNEDAAAVLALAAKGVIKCRSEVVGLGELTSTFQKMHDATLHGRVVLDLWA
ncbi:Alcohol dehydrogenase superfamily, zinc-type [Cordyceps fumosorosea ARSEF 2679]|uniref:Alcohol dehydrogenase superfamily, zinc-type n=1 Tax=Cordyceps fumosorosea (strain ARSEF 2679) TaxID=1081104 RepID=A0A167RNS9_CORFA|nr:Alcohol dehydrogenase superfamily, zinc-type [Cordyceps fumosorosea ARSEF 2679]OAA58776.1 Alcohol dehydrogenase superfamily, zinc-type [Cordyceps fumosorosea ARSEF 2679]